MPAVRVGTSGFSYPEWRGTFYPRGVPQRLWLETYAEHFDTVEINNTFYRLPRAGMLKAWAERTPANFLFAVKMWRGIVHAQEPDTRHIHDFFTALDALGGKLGPVLFQLPPGRRGCDLPWLETMLGAMPEGHRYVFELRDRRWLNDAVYGALDKHGVTNCFYDFKGFRNPEVKTGKGLYIRLHGPLSQPYRGAYDEDDIAHYAGLARRHPGGAYVYFDNTMTGHAVTDAIKMKEKL